MQLQYTNIEWDYYKYAGKTVMVLGKHISGMPIGMRAGEVNPGKKIASLSYSKV